ncbi:MAG: hypothetical protein AVDCRST_MAG59-4454 [uncultured Thermomicrobiales bacterium]|uniref:Uncharacterized protein n=1 Tax=uncultured Thermomicrobiales bacterium TaxID=1645740 RepID=A0A6J4VKF1_9BACT|nr:MAG: hypothetical protein AVDCRST_MAG59-4454 [uncultured Thermomicrobiales bacterium]
MPRRGTFGAETRGYDELATAVAPGELLVPFSDLMPWDERTAVARGMGANIAAARVSPAARGQRRNDAAARKSNCLGRQAAAAGTGVGRADRVLDKALRIVSSSCVQAVWATFLGLPAASSRS